MSRTRRCFGAWAVTSGTAPYPLTKTWSSRGAAARCACADGPSRWPGERPVSGPVSRVVVVGAGVGGLAAAVRLQALGHRVTVLEQADEVGGKLGVLRHDGYVFDTGPSLKTSSSTPATSLSLPKSSAIC